MNRPIVRISGTDASLRKEGGIAMASAWVVNVKASRTPRSTWLLQLSFVSSELLRAERGARLAASASKARDAPPRTTERAHGCVRGTGACATVETSPLATPAETAAMLKIKAANSGASRVFEFIDVPTGSQFQAYLQTKLSRQ
jgi:hypothetical protein